MQDSLSVSLRSVRESYLVGKKIPIQHNPKFSGESFDKHVYPVIYARLALDEQLLLYQFYGVRDQGLLAAQKGDITASDKFFKGSEALLHSKKLSRECFLLGKSYYEAGAAYLDYRRNDFEMAITRIHEALACDLSLEEEYGYTSFHLHRIQLVHNLMRIDIRCTLIKEALDIGYQLLDYIERKSSILTVPTTWDSSRLASLPPDLVEAAFVQITIELAHLLAGNATLSAQSLFTGMRSHTQSDVASSCHLSPHCHAWLKAKQILTDGDLVGFLKDAGLYLANGPQDTPWIWHAFVADLVVLCRSLDLPEARSIRHEITSDARMWINILPPTWRSIYTAEKEF